MMIYSIRIWGLLTAVLMPLLLVGCGEEQRDPGRPVIVTTIAPLASVVEQIVGDAADVVSLIPAGVSPHGFEPTIQQMKALSQASALVMVGAGYDAWASTAAQRQRRESPIVRFDRAVGIESDHAHHDHDDHAHGSVNPHLWVDPVLMRQFVDHLGETLPTVLPNPSTDILANTQALLKDLDALDAAFASALQPHRGKPIITYHNAFDRLAERYGLVVALTLAPDESIGATLTPARLEKALELIRRHGIKAVFAEPQFPDNFGRPLQDAGVEVLVLDPLGDPSSDDRATYQQMMRYNLAQLLEGF